MLRIDDKPVWNMTEEQINALLASKLGKVNYAQFSRPEEHIPARSIVFGIIDDANFDSPTFSHAQVRPTRSDNDLFTSSH